MPKRIVLVSGESSAYTLPTHPEGKPASSAPAVVAVAVRN
jgi:hypothetical protein